MQPNDQVERLERGAIPAELLTHDALHQIAHVRASCKTLRDHDAESGTLETIRSIMHRQEPPPM